MKQSSDRWQAMLLMILILTALVFLVSVFIPPLFKTEAKILVSCQSSSMDGACSAQAAPQIGAVLAKAIKGSVFLEKLEKSSLAFAQDLPKDQAQARLFWQERIEVDSHGTPVLSIITYDRSRQGSQNLMTAIIDTLQTEGKSFFPEVDSVQVTLIDGPWLDNRPAKPNLLLNTLWGFLASIVVVLIGVFVRENVITRPKAWGKALSRGWGQPKSEAVETTIKTTSEIFKTDDIYPIAKKKSHPDKKAKPTQKDQSDRLKYLIEPIPVFKTTRQEEVSQLAAKAATVLASNAKESSAEKISIKDQPATEKSEAQSEIHSVVKPISTVKLVSPSVEEKEMTDKIQVEQKTVAPVKASAPEPKPTQPVLPQKSPVQLSSERKAQAPDNLPIFSGDEIDVWNMPAWEKVKLPETAPKKISRIEEKAVVKKDQPTGNKQVSLLEGTMPIAPTETAGEIESVTEPTEEEIKARLNKLLRGEL